MHIDDIELAEPFMSLFPTRKDVEDDLAADMADHGFRNAFPLIMWGGILLDGYHRYAAALTNRIYDIPCIEVDFTSEDEAILFCIRANAKRRHLTDAELVRAIKEVDRINKKAAEERQVEAGRQQSPLGTNDPKGTSAAQTAQDVGVSARTVKAVRAIETHGTEQDMKDVEEGKATIPAKAKEVRERRKRPQKRLAPTDYRTEQQRRFDGACETLMNILVELKQSNWEGVGFRDIEKSLLDLLDVVKQLPNKEVKDAEL